MPLGAVKVGLFAAAGAGGGVVFAAYFAGGQYPWVATVDKFAFSDDSRTTLGTGLSNDLYAAGAMANSGTAGYVGGGWKNPSVYLATVDKFAFSDDSRTTLGTGLSSSRYGVAGAANSGTAGYFGGGSGGSYVSTVDKFAFSDDSRTTLGTGLSVARSHPAGMANAESL